MEINMVSLEMFTLIISLIFALSEGFTPRSRFSKGSQSHRILLHSSSFAAPVDLADVQINFGYIEASPAHQSWHKGRDGDLLVSSASTIAGVLAQTWESVAMKDLEHSTTILFPSCTILRERGMLSKLMDHLETCKDVCDTFGSKIVALVIDPAAPSNHVAHGPSPGLVIRRFTKSNSILDEDDDWGDWDIAPDVLDQIRNEDAELGIEGASRSELDKLLSVPASDNEIVTLSKEWVGCWRAIFQLQLIALHMLMVPHYSLFSLSR